MFFTKNMKTKFEIKTFGGRLLFEYEAENNTVKKTLEKGVSERAYLKGAYLEDAYLKGADLEGAYLKGAYLKGADLKGAYLEGADLEGAYLKGADLEGAYLKGAYLKGADLEGAYLRGIKNIPQSYIDTCSRDILYILRSLPKEVPFLREKIVNGEVDGSVYEGECACLLGTLANGDGGMEKICSQIPFYQKGTHNPAEQWFWNIRIGDTPENSEFSKHALLLVDMVIEENK